MKFSIPKLSAAAAVLTLVLGATGVQAATVSLSLSNDWSRTQVGSVSAYSNASGSTSTANTGNVYIGSYKLTNGEWVYCLSPFTHAAMTANYTPVTMASFFGAGGGYEQQFNLSSPNYTGLAPGYDNQPGMTVMGKIVSLYNWAYQDTITNVANSDFSVAEKSAAFAYALWEIEGESGAYSTSAGGLRLSGVNDDVRAYAQTLLNNVSSGNWSGFSYQAYDFKVYQASPIHGSQSFLTVTTAPENRTGIPEPSTLMLLAASGLALVVSRRRVSSKA